MAPGSGAGGAKITVWFGLKCLPCLSILAPNFKLWLECFHCHSTALKFGTQVFAELFCRANPALPLRSHWPVYFIPNGASDPLQTELLNFHSGGIKRWRGAGFRILHSYYFSRYKTCTKKKKDKIEDTVSRIWNIFYQQMYLWAVFLKVGFTENWAALVFCKLYNCLWSISSSGIKEDTPERCSEGRRSSFIYITRSFNPKHRIFFFSLHKMWSCSEDLRTNFTALCMERVL